MKNKQNLIDKIFLIILSAQTLAMGIAFAVQIILIYTSKDVRPFNREIVGKALLDILPVIIIWLVLVLANAIYFTINYRKSKNRVKMTNTAKLNLMSGYLKDFNNNLSEDLYNSYRLEEKKRKIAKLINLGVLLICSLMSILYLANSKHFAFESGETPTTKVVSMSYYLLPWVIIAFISTVIVVFYNELSAKRSIAIIKDIYKKDGRGKRSFNVNKRLELIKTITTYSLLAISIVLIIVGVVDGSAKNVLLKACAICTECIGLG